jgi:benzoyl-CoA reductase/2-hydroxyglutaryl-CoA dehydratase subunit BcrC/BadD/HgdB
MTEHDAEIRMKERVQLLSGDDIDSIITYIESCCYWNTDTPTINEPHVQELLTKLQTIKSLRGDGK